MYGVDTAVEKDSEDEEENASRVAHIYVVLASAG